MNSAMPIIIIANEKNYYLLREAMGLSGFVGF
jgi:hypothetical protein